MYNWNDQFLAVFGELDIIVANSSGQPYPTLVVEIGNTESLKSLHNKVEEYFSACTTIQLYLTIKIFSHHWNNTFALIAMLYRCTNPNNQNNNSTIPIIIKSFRIAHIYISFQNYLLNTINIPANIITGVEFERVSCNAVNITG
ncbi:hypothetical protein C1645_834887 [Glomus cerebriforme]|uniref:Uncharacterized protein n=1 Tax=Glomus cerebriforme TaxID=658196 RepID=A0A397S8U8_9GLOM|nr:hypothetical protein C1645_834887 [Glomus cerebriforme]